MVVDIVTDKGVSWMRYASDILPRVGETVSTLKPEKKEFVVLSIDHLIAPHTIPGGMYQQLATITVKEK